MKKFKCDICGNEHLFYGSMELLEPDILFKMSEEERSRRVEKFESIFDSFLLVDKSFILTKGDLFIKIKGHDDFMHWEVWVKIIPSDFFHMIENLDSKESDVNGEIVSQIPQYEKSEGERVKLIYSLKNNKDLPMIQVLSRETDLGVDYLKSIEIEKVKDWMKAIYH